MKSILVLVGLALLVAGPAAVFAPSAAASAYGIAADSPDGRSYLVATAVRDVALGTWLLALLALGARARMKAVSVFALALVAAGDAANVTMRAGWMSAGAVLVHGGAFVLLLFLGLVLWRSAETDVTPVSPSLDGSG